MDNTVVPLKEGEMLPVTQKEEQAVNKIVTDNPTITIEDFKTYFIQMFIDGIKNAPQEVVDGWIGRFGYSTRVEIIDPDTEEVFAIAPPLINTQRLRNLPVDEIINDTFTEAIEKGRNNKKIGENIIEQGVNVVQQLLEQDTENYVDNELIELLDKFDALNSLTTQEKQMAEQKDELVINSENEEEEFISPLDAKDDWFS